MIVEQGGIVKGEGVFLILSLSWYTEDTEE
jgi:hypothetical protein